MTVITCKAPFCNNPRPDDGKKKAYCHIHIYERQKYNVKQYREVLPLWAVKRCQKHGLLKPSQAYHLKNGSYTCKQCKYNFESYRRGQPRTKKMQREQMLKIRYKITQQEYEYLLLAQGNCCAICSREHEITKYGKKKPFQIDHCHQKETEGVMLIRGLLCSRCNMGLGSFLDDINLLKKAIKYLRPHK